MQVLVCETEGLQALIGDAGRMVSVRTLPDASGDAVRELKLLAALTDPHVARVVGICGSGGGDDDDDDDDDVCRGPSWAVLQYLDMGDLAIYLQYHTASRPPLR